ncbi:unnamed protein product [Vitrella brassicaformis CCMP3155]|uniref:FAM50A/XAP5 C-terminal domain-containing protein n=2 Tax=Vitrella brassicaformis TaxID=1169539 RepID=A0A0G4H3N4_VITBC|nr:unnamed protein product [Vitrella brassicaformis CCMP3155]|eukprot:CEM38334.1 unnamed protein product [Vitrella brassicaformis CCMP3155]
MKTSFDPRYDSANSMLQTIHSSEGGRAFLLLRQREKLQREMEQAKEKIENETKKRTFSAIDSKFGGSHAEALEEKFKQETIGLVSAEEFREKRKKITDLMEEHERQKEEEKEKERAARRKGKTKLSKLSFGEDADDQADQEVEQEIRKAAGKKHLGKDPHVNTDMLPDPDRDAALAAHRQQLIEEYVREQERIKEEVLEVTYSYWDGSGHRRIIRITKGTTIGSFLDQCRKNLEVEFPELRQVGTDNLMYIKEDLILPHTVTFYDLIKNKARGKTGPLFRFDVPDDIRIYADVRVEKDESHAGKIVDRKWYERNKHIYPASTWEVYDPNKTYEASRDLL